MIKPRPHQQQCRSNIWFVAKNGYNVKRVYRKISPFRQSRMLLRHCCLLATLLNEISSFRQSRNKLNMFNLFRLCRKDEISFDIVAKKRQQYRSNIHFVERIIRLLAFDDIASTLLLVWTGLKSIHIYWPNDYRTRTCHVMLTHAVTFRGSLNDCFKASYSNMYTRTHAHQVQSLIRNT